MASEPRTLILSMDYELFFGRSGTVEKCLFIPCDALVAVARSAGVHGTFFIDAGMILRMEHYAGSDRRLAKMVDQIRKHIAQLASLGHEIALHVHPHWEDSVWREGEWDFSGTRYQLRDFSMKEVSDIFSSYSDCLAELSGQQPTAYRAGGFCIEPFNRALSPLSENGIYIDSSVVPGALLNDDSKGFDFRQAPDADWWFFDKSPNSPKSDGQFLELPITPHRLPATYYWSRLINRMRHAQGSASFGDGQSKNIGRREIIRRLVGLSRVAELSIDDPKAGGVSAHRFSKSPRQLWHLMGHPKLLSPRSIGIFKDFVEQMNFQRRESLTSVASLIRSGEIRPAR